MRKEISLIVLLLIYSNILDAHDTSEVRLQYYTPENILAFALHLEQQTDYIRAALEYQRYLIVTGEKRSDIFLRIGKNYYFAGDYSRAESWFRNIIDEFAGTEDYQKAVVELLRVLYSKGEYSALLENSHAYQQLLSNHYRQEIDMILGIVELRQGRWSAASARLNNIAPPTKSSLFDATIEALRQCAREGLEIGKKSPLWAGSLSAIVPGMGRFYVGDYGDGMYSIIYIALTSWLSYRGFSSNGIESVTGWTLGILSGVLYISNIYGSAIAAREYNRMQSEIIQRRIDVTISLYNIF